MKASIPADGRGHADLKALDVQRLLEARLHDPRRVLGPHPLGVNRVVVRALLPHAAEAELVQPQAALRRVSDTALFEWAGSREDLPVPYRLRWRPRAGKWVERFDPYCFPPQLVAADLAAFARGDHTHAHRFLGAHSLSVDGVCGVQFAVWAPNAQRVSVIGDFNRWDGRFHPMTARGNSGVWEIFIPELTSGELYKFEISNRESGALRIKSDPFGRLSERRPATASVTSDSSPFAWRDGEWMAQRSGRDWLREPISVYEMHAGSWRRDAGGGFLSYGELAEALVPYVKDLGFTHVELMPVTEHPLDDSWGYQTTGYFAATRRHGEPDGLRRLICELHRNRIGVILDWVPGHFPRDDHGLARFDGSPVFEYADSQKGEHPDWDTLVFDYARNEVRSFLYSSAIYWLEDFHFDGLRVDAVASMLYLDYSRKHGQWTPNVYGGNENLEAIAFLKRLNEITHGTCPGTLTIAEESTAWPGVSRPTYSGGLGFTLKWNMGWMHDTLAFLRNDPVHRRFHHNLLTFGPLYAFSENFLLPLSHDEVVHGKGALLERMPGDRWQRFANLRLAYTFQWTYPGKKLLFMGGEFGQTQEWNHREALSWQLTQEPLHAGIQSLIKDLNRLYRTLPALHRGDTDPAGFRWLSWEDQENSVLSYLRRDVDQEVVVLLNFTPVPRHGYRVGVPSQGVYKEVFNSDSRFYGGSDLGNPLPLKVESIPCMGHAQSLSLTLPPLGGVLLMSD